MVEEVRVNVAHTDRGPRTRLISARPSTRGEREAYENEIQSAKADEFRAEYDFARVLKDAWPD